MSSYDLAEAPTHGPLWSLVETEDGTLLWGADQVVQFDGASSQRINIPGGYAVRGLARIKDRVYVGATGELGFLEKGPAGQWVYVSLLPQLEAAGLQLPKEIWSAMATADGVVFAGSDRLLRYDGTAFQEWVLPGRLRLQTFPLGNEIWFYQQGVGVRRLDATGPVTVYTDRELPETPVIWALAAPDGNSDEGLILGTSDSVYVRESGKWRQLPEVSAAIKGHLAVAAVALPFDRIAVATYLNGLVIAGRDGQVESVVNRAQGLPDDHLYGLWLDSHGGLWVGLSEGAARLRADQAETLFTPEGGLEDGPVRKVLAHAGKTWVITAKSVYALQPRTQGTNAAKVARVSGVESLFWDAAAIGDQLFVGGFGGLWRQGTDTSTAWVPEYRISGDVFRLLPFHAGNSPLLVFAEQDRLRALEYLASGLPNAGTDAGWVPRDLGQSLNETPLSIVTDDGGDVWVSTVKAEVTRYKLAGGTGRPLFRLISALRPGRGLPEQATRPVLVTLGNALFAFTETQILKHNPLRGVFEPEEQLQDYIGLSAAAGYWLVQSKALGPLAPPVVLRVRMDENGGVTTTPLPVQAAAMVGRISSLSLTREGTRDILWLGGTKGLLRLAVPESEVAPSPPRVQIQPGVGAEKKPAKASDGRFGFVADTAGTAPTFYQTWLTGAESAWNSPQREATRAYTGLAPGEYVFRVRALDAWGRAGPDVQWPLVIATPNWRRWPALTGYAAVLVLAGLGGARWRIRRLQRQNERLNRLVDDRTRELELRSRELELSNTAKSEFLESISHEIRNPLQGIRGFVAMMREASLPPPQQELAASLAACAGALTRTFDEVLGFAKIESGQLPVHRRGFNLVAVVDEVVALHRVMARQRGCELQIVWEDSGHPGDRPRRFIGDGERLKTVLGNFLGNAIKYAPGQPVLLTVECETDGARAANLTLSVRDHGPGVPLVEQELIFRKFVRGSQAKESRVPGTGLGLATCRVLAEQMGGSVGMESPPAEGGNGTLFFIKLWLRRDLEPAPAPESEGGKPSIASALGRRALIIEDQDYNQVITLRVVQQLGFEAEVAQDGIEAQRKLQSGPFAVLFVDWEMPGIKGDEIARQVRKLPWGPNAVIVATTGHDSEAIKAACLAAGMDAFVLKPFDELVLARALDQAREKKGQAPLAVRNASGLDIRPFSMVGQGDPNRTAQAAADYLLSLQQELTALDRDLTSRHWPGVASTAHRLRTHAGIVAAHALGESARRLQQQAQAADETGCRISRDDVWREAEAVGLHVEMATGVGADLRPVWRSTGT